LDAQQRQRGNRHPVHPHHVHRKSRGQIVGCNLGQRPDRVDHARVVDQHVQPPGIGGDPGNGRIDICLAGHVQLQLRNGSGQRLGAVHRIDTCIDVGTLFVKDSN